MAKKGIKVIPEVMIPLIGGVKELENQKRSCVEWPRRSSRRRGMKIEVPGRHHDRDPARGADGR